MRKLVILGLLAVSACEQPADCDRVGRHFRDVAVRELQHHAPAAEAEGRGQLLYQQFVDECREKRFRKSHAKCILDAETLDEMAQCKVPE